MKVSFTNIDMLKIYGLPEFGVVIVNYKPNVSDSFDSM